MFRIDGPGATNDNKFTEGDPASGTRATVVTDEWLNAVQEEVARAIEDDGYSLDKFDSGQLSRLIRKRTIYVDGVTELRSIAPIAGQQADLNDGYRSGKFAFIAGDQASNVSGDPLNGIWIAPDTDPTGASGAWRRVYDGITPDAKISAGWYGGVGAADAILAIEAARDKAILTGVRRVALPGPEYIVSRTIKHETTDLLASTPVNGVVFEGEGELATVIKPAAGFTSGDPLVEFNGNPTGQDVDPVGQTYSGLKGVKLDCDDVAAGLRLRAVSYSDFDHVWIFRAGDALQGAITFKGLTAEGRDDIDTSYSNKFNRVRITAGAGHGILAKENRLGQTTFDNCDIRNCALDGARVSFAALTFNETTFANNGSSSSTGGLSVIKSQTGAVNRGLAVNNCQFEGNHAHEIAIDHCFGFEINGGLYTPFVGVASGQAVFKIGIPIVNSGTVRGGRINAPRIAAYSAPGGEVIEAFQIGIRAGDVEISGDTYDETSTTNWATQDRRYNVSPDASDIVINGDQVSKRNSELFFQHTLVESASPVANATGDGTEFFTSTLAGTSTSFADLNNGPQREAFIATAESSGNTLTVTAVTGTPIRVGNRISHPDFHPNTYVKGFGTGTGGTGTYTTNISQTVASNNNVAFWSSQWFDQKTGVFTAPKTGFYKFRAKWPLTGWDGSQTDVEVNFAVNRATNPARHKAVKKPIPTYAAGDVVYFSGEATIFLEKDDEVEASVIVAGGAKVIDVYREDPTGYMFVGESA